MHDIAKCPGECNGIACSVRETCWRYVAPSSSDWQTWILPMPMGDNCEHYWPVQVKKEGKTNHAN